MSIEKRVKETRSTRTQLLSKVAWLYYHNDLTQGEIAEKLGISRVTINRLLAEARETGIVEIKVHTGKSESFELEQALCSQYGLSDAVVIAELAPSQDLRPALAEAAADVLEQRLTDGVDVGIGIGRTVASIPDFIKMNAHVNCQFVGLTGGLVFTGTSVPHTFDTLSRLAYLTGGQAIYIPAPSYVNDPLVHKTLLKEPSVVLALKAAAACDLAIFSVGALDYSALLYEYGQITAAEIEELKRSNVAGDILGRFFNQQGEELAVEPNQRVIGLHLEELKKIPTKILIGGGENKKTAVSIALRSGYCDILVTDVEQGKWLLQNE